MWRTEIVRGARAREMDGEDDKDRRTILISVMFARKTSGCSRGESRDATTTMEMGGGGGGGAA